MNDTFLDIKEGDRWPGWRGSFEGSVLTIDEHGLFLLVSLPLVRPEDISDFRQLTGCGLFEGEFPLVIWRFGQNFLLPTPFNPEFERQQNTRSMEDFLAAESPRFKRALIDRQGMVRVLATTYLNQSFIDLVRRWWKPSAHDWHRYNKWLNHAFKTPTHQMWAKANVFREDD